MQEKQTLYIPLGLKPEQKSSMDLEKKSFSNPS